MTEPYVGEIRMFSFSRTPVGWLACDGSMHDISSYETLYTLIGTTYGGNGATNFAVPDMRGRVPVRMGQGPSLSNHVLGQSGGSEEVALAVANLPAHTHTFEANSAGGTVGAPSTASVLAGLATYEMYQASDSSETTITLSPSSVVTVGGNQPHNNLAPTLTVNFCIAYVGLFPTHS